MFDEPKMTEGPKGKIGEPGVERETLDSVETYFQIDLPLAWKDDNKPRWLIAYAPYVKTHTCPQPQSNTTVELVHHMNMVLGKAKGGVDSGDDENDRNSDRDSGEDNDIRFVANYDRGALGFVFERDEMGVPTTTTATTTTTTATTTTTTTAFKYGILLQDTKRPVLKLEYHLLKPHCWDWNLATPVLEDSGFDLYVTSERPTHGNAAFLGFTDESLEVVPHRGMADEMSLATSVDLSKMFLGDGGDGGDGRGGEEKGAGVVVGQGERLGQGSMGQQWQQQQQQQQQQHPQQQQQQWPENVQRIKLIAVHIHTHDIFQQKYIEIVSAAGVVRFRSKVETTGYGVAEQTMFSGTEKGWPQDEMWIYPGEELVQHCIVDTTTLVDVVRDGTSWGQEMCALLFIVGGKGITTPPTQVALGLVKGVEGGVRYGERTERSEGASGV